ncbi:MAG TPA: YfcE family phosphodiesterase [Planctomycetaceae bacterium]|nr:YfcE family phosphodiesterase [Planctomycetaceae bacterium]
MQIAVVSDTHGHVASTREAVRVLEALGVAAVLHCGDIGSPAIVPLFAAWPAHFVFGNVDQDESDVQRAIEAAGQTCHGRFGSVELAGRRIAFLHGDDAAALAETIDSGQYDLVCYGHTHRAEHHMQDGTLVLNPGALYRANPHSFAVVDLSSMDVWSIPLSG